MIGEKLRRFAGAIIALAALAVVAAVAPPRAADAIDTIGYSVGEMLLVLPPIFVLLGLLDVWVPRERFIQYMGEDTGVRGASIAFAMGSFAAGPLYAAFPIATMLLKKGASIFNVMVFVGAWSTTKLPMILFESTALGTPFALTRLAANIPAILMIAAILARFGLPADHR